MTAVTEDLIELATGALQFTHVDPPRRGSEKDLILTQNDPATGEVKAAAIRRMSPDVCMS